MQKLAPLLLALFSLAAPLGALAADPSHPVWLARSDERVPLYDRARAVDFLAQRVQRLLPIVHGGVAHVDRQLAAARVRFWMTSTGYARDARLIRSSGNARVDRSALEAVRMAEPFAFVQGWIELDLRAR